MKATPTASPASERAREAADALIDNPWSLDRRQGYREAFAAFEHRILADQASVGDGAARGSGVREALSDLLDLFLATKRRGGFEPDILEEYREVKAARAALAALSPAAPATQRPDALCPHGGKAPEYVDRNGWKGFYADGDTCPVCLGMSPEAEDHIPDAGKKVGDHNADASGSGVGEALDAADYLIETYKRLWEGGVSRDLAEAIGWYEHSKRAALSPAPSAQGDATNAR